MKLLLSILSIFILSSTVAQNVEFDWAFSIGGDGYDRANVIEVGSDGNIYTAGEYRDSVNFDPGSGTVSYISNGENDIFITKTTPQGQLIWAKSIGGVGIDNATDIHIDQNNNLYISGYFQDVVDFDPNAGSEIRSSNGDYDAYVVKLDDTGNLLWVSTFGDAGYDAANAIQTDLSGAVFITGLFNGTVDFDPGMNTFTLTSNSSADAYVLKLDENGSFIWARSWGGSIGQGVYGLALDSTAHLYIAGRFQSNIDFDPGTGTEYISPYGMKDGFLTKLDSSGNYVWTKKFGGNEDEYCHGIEIDANNNLIIIGSFRSTAYFPSTGTPQSATSNGDTDIFIFKTDTSGNTLFLNTYGGIYPDAPYGVYAFNNQYFITGSFTDSVEFNNGLDQSTLYSNGSDDVFILKLNTNGQYEYVKQIGDLYSETGYSIAAGEYNSNVKVYSTGIYSGTVDFDFTPSTYELTWNGGSYDYYVHSFYESTANITAIEKEDFIIYPNPSDDHFTIRTPSEQVKSIKVYKIDGTLVYVDNQPKSNVIHTALPSGTYIVNVQTNSKSLSKKIMVYH